MSLLEPRCLVCGAPLGKSAPFEKSVRKSEVCSDRCYEIYMADEDNNGVEQMPSNPASEHKP